MAKAEEKLTAQHIVDYLIRGGFESSIDKREGDFAPWKFLTGMEGEKLARWYEGAKPEKDIAEMRETDPARAASLVQGAKDSHWLKATRNKIYSDTTLGTFEERREHAGKLATEYPEQTARAVVYEEFREKSIFDFRAENYPVDSIWASNTSGCLTNYALFSNPETGEFLVTMRDSRTGEPNKKAFVDHIIIEGKGRDAAEIMPEVQWLWAKHLTHYMAFSPITDRNKVNALHEADRLRAKFANAARATEATRPNRNVFEFFPAFRRAYSGKEGFLQALNDVYGIRGNVAHCDKEGVFHNDWGGYTSGEKIAKEYEITEGMFIRLYEQMGDADRKDFKGAFNEFLEKTLPTLDTIHDITGQLAIIKNAIDFGSGAYCSVNDLTLFSEAQMMLSDVADGKKSYAEAEADIIRNNNNQPLKPIW